MAGQPDDVTRGGDLLGVRKKRWTPIAQILTIWLIFGGLWNDSWHRLNTVSGQLFWTFRHFPKQNLHKKCSFAGGQHG